MLKSLCAAIVVLVLLSCESEKKDLLIGEWKEVGTGNSIMKYNNDGSYIYNYDDGTTVSGKWRLDGTTLYTTEKGESLELSEELTTLDNENLVSNVAGMFETKYSRTK